MLKRSERVSRDENKRYWQIHRLIRDRLKRSILVSSSDRGGSSRLWLAASEAYEVEFASYTLEQIEGFVAVALRICLDRDDEPMTAGQQDLARRALEMLQDDCANSVSTDIAQSMEQNGTDWLIGAADFASWTLCNVRVA